MAGFHGKKQILFLPCKKKLANTSLGRALNSNKSNKEKKIFGRRLGRPLNKERQNALDIFLPQLDLSKEIADAPPEGIDPSSLFKAPCHQTWLEIGFGNGEHLSELMRTHTDAGFIGVEPFINGMAYFLKDIKDMPHDRIRVLMDDAMILADALAPESIDGVYILNPDPWPKKRHHKRRIVNQANLTKLARILKPGARLIMATDVDDLAEWMVTQAINHPSFVWDAEKKSDWTEKPSDWIETRYEQKGQNAGRRQSYLLFRRKTKAE